MLDVMYNRLKNDVYVLCVKLKKKGNLRRYAASSLNLGEYIGDFIEAVRIVFDDTGYNSSFNNKTQAMNLGIITDVDIYQSSLLGVEIMTIYPKKLHKLLDGHPRLIPELEKYLVAIDFLYIDSISKEYVNDALNDIHNIIKRVREKQTGLFNETPPPIVPIPIRMTLSLSDTCMAGFINRPRLYSILKETRPELVSKDRYMKHDNPVFDAVLISSKEEGKLIIKLW